jgi:Fur family transcriptional regulator, ferric uptake regulator
MKERLTKQKKVVLEVLKKEDRHLKADEIYDLARKNYRNIGLATVYRNIETMVERGVLDVIFVAGKPKWYEIKKRGYHGHTYCEICGHLSDLTSCLLCLTKNRIITEIDFEVKEVKVLVVGKCNKCQATK